LAELSLDELIAGNDVAGLLRRVDGLCSARAWGELAELRGRCHHAGEQGKQLWGPAQYAEYRLALDAPAEWAGTVIDEGVGRFARGPLWEVAASRLTWEELAGEVSNDRFRTLVGYERALRGETVDGDPRFDPHLLEVPAALQPWEPAYPVAGYRPDKAEFPEPVYSSLAWTELPGGVGPVADHDAAAAFHELTSAWTEQSNGRAESVAIEGTAEEAIATLGPRRVRLARIELAEALAYVAWSAASGGAHGRRRGTAIGRYNGWWLVAALGGLAEHWPLHPDEVGEEAAALAWYRWDPGDQAAGWGFHLAVHDLDHGLAWAASAADAV
jgi:hypothetical protein